jgi:anaerobic selenocysteine-containing dehydrogenase
LNPPAWTGENYQSVMDYITDYFIGGTGVSFEQLREEVTHQRVVGYKKYETGHLRPDGKPGFNTQTGRIELYSYAYQMYGEDPLPYYVEPPYSPVSTPEVFEKYPFVLTTGARMYTYFHSEGRQIPYLREINPDPIFEVSPEDAAKKGVHDGDWVRIENQFGFCLQKVKVTPVIKPGVVHAQHGWWFPEESGEYPHFFGTWKSNINSLVPHSRNGKLGFGAPYKNGLCDFRKACEQDFIDVDREGIDQPGMPKHKYDDNFYRVDKVREARA